MQVDDESITGTTVQDGKARRFEDVIAWQKGFDLTLEIYRLTNYEAFAQDRGLVRQIQRAAVTIPASIAAGYERGNPSEFDKRLRDAQEASAEVRAYLYLARDLGYVEAVTATRQWSGRLRLAR